MTFGNPSAIVVAHPGHEVRVHGFVERERPRVFVLTDGSGRTGRPRIAATARYLDKFGARPGAVFGRFTDSDVYSRVLARDFKTFVRLAEELAESFASGGVSRVVGDASEGYNTTHDIARLVANAAVELASRARRATIANYDFPVVRRPDHCPARLRERSVWLRLDDAAFARKLAAAFEFYPELAAEAQDSLRGRGDERVAEHFDLRRDEQAATDLSGLDVFRVECLRPVSPAGPPFDGRVPFYELQGEMRVAEGIYERVIRYREHLRPLAEALAESVERRS
jgi:histone H3/H4